MNEIIRDVSLELWTPPEFVCEINETEYELSPEYEEDAGFRPPDPPTFEQIFFSGSRTQGMEREGIIEIQVEDKIQSITSLMRLTDTGAEFRFFVGSPSMDFLRSAEGKRSNIRLYRPNQQQLFPCAVSESHDPHMILTAAFSSLLEGSLRYTLRTMGGVVYVHEESKISRAILSNWLPEDTNMNIFIIKME